MAQAALQEKLEASPDSRDFALWEQELANNGTVVGLPDVLVIPAMEEDALVREKAARFIGKIATEENGYVESIQPNSSISSLHEAIQRASEGDPTALSMVETNVKTDVIERTIKAGHVMTPVPLSIMPDGSIMQYGQSIKSIQANSLRYAAEHPVMRQRTEAEARNAFRIEECNRAGLLEDNVFVVISRAENLPNFFTETMSCCLQATSKEGGGLTTESAFVAGVAKPGESPHDEATVVELGRLLGVDLAGKTAAEIIDTPLLIPKKLLTNGAIDLVKLYDQAAGGTFFGEAKPGQDYLAYLEQCRKREKTFEPKVRQITKELLASASTLTTPQQAVQKLHKLAGAHMVEHAINTDRSIDPRVFGVVAAPQIELARLADEYGDQAARDRYLQTAKATERSISCPDGMKKPDEYNINTNDQTGSSKQESDKDCDFISKKCPMCGEKNVKTTVTKTHIKGACGCVKKK